MTNTAQQPPAFQQPVLVDCTAGCGRKIAYNAASCPNCGKTDPALLENDPKKRTLARKQYDESPLVRAWNQHEAELKRLEKEQEQKEREHKSALEKYYKDGGEFIEQGYSSAKLSIACFVTGMIGIGILQPPRLVGVAFLAVIAYMGYDTISKILTGKNMQQEALENGYSVPKPLGNPGRGHFG